MQSGYRWWRSVEKSHFREIIHLISKRDPVSKHPVHSTRSSLRRASSSSRNVSHQNSKRPTLLPLPTQRFIVWCTASETYLQIWRVDNTLCLSAKNDLFLFLCQFSRRIYLSCNLFTQTTSYIWWKFFHAWPFHRLTTESVLFHLRKGSYFVERNSNWWKTFSILGLLLA